MRMELLHQRLEGFASKAVHSYQAHEHAGRALFGPYREPAHGIELDGFLLRILTKLLTKIEPFFGLGPIAPRMHRLISHGFGGYEPFVLQILFALLEKLEVSEQIFESLSKQGLRASGGRKV
jgi:hypothetical protein